ncbi:DDE Tnp IS1595 domain-containing protein [Aphis craccivora]|uniref:DDE Tnp IS1595 domain-containing protein n=1 Tax=Aphis craccivora TaxID=307492 RepID=A0A6G0Z0E5_APHCR|nr:DDE Tnp IS1595 domain-containing protein [Aphis craccivora]
MKFVRRKNNAGHIIPQQWVFGGICRETKECFITLAIIFSDSWKSYANLQQHGFQHNQVNHKYNFVNPNSGTHTQNVERMCGAAKWGNKKRRGTDRNFLDSYLAEFMWRSKLNNSDPFETILKDIAEFRESLKA